MSEATAGNCSQREQLMPKINGYPRDLLRRFSSENDRGNHAESVVDDSEEIELNLGLSLGGRFGVDPKEKRLTRSSSIAGLELLPRDPDMTSSPAALTLIRTCSLPTETEEEWRKRKEMQSLRRLEAKRKRSEKQRSFRPVKDLASLGGELEEDKRGDGEGLTSLMFKGKVVGSGSISSAFPGSAPANGFSSLVVMPLSGFPSRASLGADVANAKGSLFSNSAPMQGFQPSSQGSLGSQGSSSSGESRSRQGSSNSMEAKSPVSIQSLPDRIEQKVVITASTPKQADEKSMKPGGGKKPQVESGSREMERNVMEEMPCVSTRGDGPNGRRIEGFLYKYRKGEEVRIVCVCHGSFLSPAEFVKHAGGGDVTHPLRHIVVNPTPSSFL